MYIKQAKKMLVMNILEILKKYSDIDHRLTQQDIIRYLKEDYEMKVDRKSIKRNIDDLIDEGHDINFDEIERGKGKYKNKIRTNYYLLREFDNSELRLLIDGLIFSKYIPYSQCKGLIEKLESLSNKYFKARTKYIQLLKEDNSVNKELFYNIDIIDEAIQKKKKVSFFQCLYDVNKKLVHKLDEKGNNKEYIANPYYMVALNGRYYMICTFDGYREIVNVRLDRIQEIKIINEKRDENNEKSINLSQHMGEHLYMLGGESANVSFEFPEYLISDVIDWFGNNITFTRTKNNKILGTSKVNLSGMKYWALQYGEHIKVLSPKKLVDDIKSIIKHMGKVYKLNGK